MTTDKRIVSKRWADVTKHDLVQLDGDLYQVVKVKPTDAGKVKVTIREQVDSAEEFTAKMRASDGVDVVELVKRKAKKWADPQGEAETLIAENLGGTLVGVQLGADELWVCPEVDLSTIASHLYLFHGIGPVDLRREGGYADAVRQHQAEHDKPLDQIKQPHVHEADRPGTERVRGFA